MNFESAIKAGIIDFKFNIQPDNTTVTVKSYSDVIITTDNVEGSIELADYMTEAEKEDLMGWCFRFAHTLTKLNLYSFDMSLTTEQAKAIRKTCAERSTISMSRLQAIVVSAAKEDRYSMDYADLATHIYSTILKLHAFWDRHKNDHAVCRHCGLELKFKSCAECYESRNPLNRH